ncbi:rhomboid family intramembrane serine protease [Actinacidiphila acidipaludis]|uniref:Rhomboid family intramembrane serine protease n=1 Tax=Actinacidiphila acidipaludis TaxID=2873382 RepID=A0ABS7QE06_9ACTN|nr:rhomboid family intramembrane serine protease [Streptomyces acidipaludis]MBY8881352.1 rhomboid family intramembrane serine protease [Streptomyces acidipaludis]
MDQAVCCYRHPDRETGIRCTRCDKPICPECMVNASVGFHCRDCVNQRGGTHVQPRTIAGGSVTSDPFLITKILIGLNVLVFVLELALGDRIVDDFGLYAKCVDLQTLQPARCGVSDGEWYRVLTSAFIHERPSPVHIGFNMLSLWWIGAPLEQRLGRSRYIALYFVSALGASAAVLVIAPGALTIGASGAIFGLFGATAVYMRRMRYDMRPVIALLVLNIIFSFTWANVSWQGHLGGLLTGTVLAIGMLYAPRERRNLVQWGTCAAVLLVTLAVSAIAVSQVTS